MQNLFYLAIVPVMAISIELYEAIEFCGFLGGDSTGMLVKYPPGGVSFISTVDVFSIEVKQLGTIAKSKNHSNLTYGLINNNLFEMSPICTILLTLLL